MRDGAKEAVLNGRALWTFSAAYRLIGEKAYLATAEKAFAYCKTHFIDGEYGWVYRLLDVKGETLDDNKDIYAGTFILFAFSEYYLASEDKEGLDLTIRLYTELEAHAYDARNGGYFDTFRKDWRPILNADGTADDSKSLRTQLHVLECYTNLFLCWPDPGLKRRIEELLRHLCEDVPDAETGALKQRFAADWRALGDEDVFGDDVEGSWLFPECAALAGADSVKPLAVELAKRLMGHVLENGYDAAKGGLFAKNTDHGRDWWSQCEALNAFLDFYVRTGEEHALLIDPTWTMLPLRKYVEEYVTDKPLWVACTHSHHDHTNANWMFNDCPFFMSQIAWEETQARRELSDEEGKWFGHQRGVLFTGDEIEGGQMLVSGRPGSKVTVEGLRENVARLIEGWGDKIDVLCPPHNGAPVHVRFLEYIMENCDRIMSGEEPGDLDVGSMSYLYNPLEDRPAEQIQRVLNDPKIRRSEWKGSSIVFNTDWIFKKDV